MTNTKFYALTLIAAVASLIGFCVENFFIFTRHGFIDNRNMVLPFLFGYGLAILAFNALFGTPKSPLFLGKEISLSGIGADLYCFAIAFLGVSLGEIILGYATQHFCGIIWWDYTSLPLHITRYTSVPTSAGFALLIALFMKHCFEPMLKYFSAINASALALISISLMILLSLDFIHSAVYMFKNHDTLKLWRYELKTPLKEIFAKVT